MVRRVSECLRASNEKYDIILIATPAVQIINETWVAKGLGKVPRTAETFAAFVDELLSEDVHAAISRL